MTCHGSAVLMHLGGPQVLIACRLTEHSPSCHACHLPIELAGLQSNVAAAKTAHRCILHLNTTSTAHLQRIQLEPEDRIQHLDIELLLLPQVLLQILRQLGQLAVVVTGLGNDLV